MADTSTKRQLGVDDRFQRTEWAFQRVGWVVMAALLVSGLLGLLGGGGPLANGEATSADGRVRIQYDRFARRHRDSQLLRIEVSPQSAADTCRVTINQAYLSRINFREISPLPESVEAAGGAHVFSFRSGKGDTPLILIFPGEFEKAGPAAADLRVDGSSISFRQWVYP